MNESHEMTQLIGGQAKAEPRSLFPHPTPALFGGRLQKYHDSVVSSLSKSLGLPKETHQNSTMPQKADGLPLHTNGWLFRVALPSTPDKSGQPVEEGRSLLEQAKSKEHSQRQDEG